MTKTKTIMDMIPQELITSLTASIGETTKAQIHTALIPVHAELKELTQRVGGLEQRVGGLEKGQERIEQKLDRITEDHEERLTRLEQAADLTHKN